MNYIGSNLKENDCTIVGFFNASIWLKNYISYEDIEWVGKQYYGYDPEGGLKTSFVSDFMNFLGIPHKVIEIKSISELEQKILSGTAVLLATSLEGQEDKGHMLFLKPNGKEIEVINHNLSWIDIVIKFKSKKIDIKAWGVGKAA